ncbi:MAG TPA: GNAT family N-acetyltransferase [Anaerolineales bacterium]|nr:GNAT family N-acetyltransferase [Anaerolineales bacterium]
MITEYPLTKVNRLQLAKAFRNIPRVDLSIDCVIEGQMGKAYVDDIQNPSVYKIQTGPFFYFAGNVLSEGGQEMLRAIQPWTLFMPSSEGWIEAGKSMYGEQLIGFDRYSFSSECLSLEHLEKLVIQSAFSKEVKRMDLALATQVWGQDHFIDISDFESPSDFVERGIGYYAERNGTIVGAAFSSLACSNGIEVSIFVLEEYRRQGMATTLAAHMLKWCLENSLDPHWDAANPESCKLAEKLGYIPKGNYRAYYLKG